MWVDERDRDMGKRKRTRILEGCGSAALEKRNRWIGSWWFWLLPMRSRRSSGSAENFQLRGPGTGGVWVVGCGLWIAGCAVLTTTLSCERPQSEETSTPFLAPLPPHKPSFHFLLCSLTFLLTPYTISSYNSDMEFFPP